eukprot:TRINITY_DN65067_c0_g1_i1.p2 TRINITY_DN65067_c0_g1~~TRINITY_DN65067_c0_g1_i1.p2  ORF type:complete len:121 (-),score=6.43 TRINITY_DN65067_c0_g1_i1:34-396(-)
MTSATYNANMQRTVRMYHNSEHDWPPCAFDILAFHLTPTFEPDALETNQSRESKRSSFCVFNTLRPTQEQDVKKACTYLYAYIHSEINISTKHAREGGSNPFSTPLKATCLAITQKSASS